MERSSSRRAVPYWFCPAARRPEQTSGPMRRRRRPRSGRRSRPAPSPLPRGSGTT